MPILQVFHGHIIAGCHAKSRILRRVICSPLRRMAQHHTRGKSPLSDSRVWDLPFVGEPIKSRISAVYKTPRIPEIASV